MHLNKGTKSVTATSAKLQSGRDLRPKSDAHFVGQIQGPVLSIVVSALIYLSYGLSRILSMAMDGMPAEGLVQVAVLEIVTGLVCVFALVKYRETE